MKTTKIRTQMNKTFLTEIYNDLFTLFCDLPNPISFDYKKICAATNQFFKKAQFLTQKSQKRVNSITKKGEILAFTSQKRVKRITKKGELHHKKGLNASQKRVNDISESPILSCFQRLHIISIICTIILFNNTSTTSSWQLSFFFSIKGKRYV